LNYKYISMIGKKHIDSFLQDQWNIILDLSISTNNSLRLEEDRYEYEADIKKHGFYLHHWYQLRFIAIIQLAKLFSNKKTEKRSFFKLCSMLEGGDYSKEFERLLANNAKKSTQCAKSKDEILPIISEIKRTLNENNASIRKIIDARDQIYAHHDPNPKAEYITTEEISHLTKIAINLHNTFEFKLFYRSTMFAETDSWTIDYVLFYMNEMKKKDKEEHQARLRK
jgi:hypothetical protein